MSVINMAQKSKDEIELEDLPGVGPSIAEKLREAGVTTIMALAVSSPSTLSEIGGIGASAAAKIIRSAREQADVGGFETGMEVLEKRKTVRKITTCAENLDAIIGGGIETQSITEFYGEFGCGKTQIAHQLAVSSQLPAEKGGLAGEVAIIDTENTFRPERIIQMAEALELDPEEVLAKIHVARAFNSDHQMLLVDKIEEIAAEKNIKLVIVDSLTAHFRAEYVGRGTLATRQQHLNTHMHSLLKLAQLHDLAVVVTNQVSAKPDTFFGDPTVPIGGHVVGHTAAFRIYIRKSKANTRICRLIDSPNYPEAEAVISVLEDGIRNGERAKKR